MSDDSDVPFDLLGNETAQAILDSIRCMADRHWIWYILSSLATLAMALISVIIPR